VGLTDSEVQSTFGTNVLLNAETDALQYSNSYNIANPGSYKYYKINVTDTSNRTYDSYTMITEIAYYI
jgi:ribosomal protein L15E